MKKEDFEINVELLNESIEHWKKNVKIGNWIIVAWESCACCTYNDNYVMRDCEPCPIYLVTGSKSCKGTNYRGVVNAIRQTLLPWQDPEAKIEANLMLSDLYSIRRQFIVMYWKGEL